MSKVAGLIDMSTGEGRQAEAEESENHVGGFEGPTLLGKHMKNGGGAGKRWTLTCIFSIDGSRKIQKIHCNRNLLVVFFDTKYDHEFMISCMQGSVKETLLELYVHILHIVYICSSPPHDFEHNCKSPNFRCFIFTAKTWRSFPIWLVFWDGWRKHQETQVV